MRRPLIASAETSAGSGVPMPSMAELKYRPSLTSMMVLATAGSPTDSAMTASHSPRMAASASLALGSSACASREVATSDRSSWLPESIDVRIR